MNTLIMTNMFKTGILLRSDCGGEEHLASGCSATLRRDKSILLRSDCGGQEHPPSPRLRRTRASKQASKQAFIYNKALLQSGVISARFSSICNRKDLSCDPVPGTTAFLLSGSFIFNHQIKKVQRRRSRAN